MKMMKGLKISGVAFLLGCSCLTAHTSADAADMISLNVETVPNVVGIGIGFLPDYVGSDDYTWGIAPFARYTFEGTERYIQLLANELTVNLLNDKMFRVGPLLNYHFGRDDVDDDAVDAMKDIDDTIEAGAFADVTWYFSEDRRHRFMIGARVYQDIGNESDGFRANLNARYWIPVAEPVDLGFTVGAFYQDDDYSDYYFGVNANNVGTSGLPFYDSESGVNEYYMMIGGVLYLDRHWLVSAGIRGSVIAGDPADSPIVDQRGDTTQWIGGIGVGYAF